MRLTKQYAYALLNAIAEEQAVATYHELVRINEVFKSLPEYIMALDFKPENFSLIRSTLGETFDSILINFLEVLAQDGLLSRLSTIIEDYRMTLVENDLLFDVQVHSAQTLNEKSKQTLENMIEQRWGSNYLVEYSVDKKNIGGIRLELNGAVIDTTFRSRIDQIVREVQHGSKR